MKSIQVNPFIIGAYAGSHYFCFCDCERETDELVQDLTNVRNVVLVAQRRMGKTGCYYILSIRRKSVNIIMFSL